MFDDFARDDVDHAVGRDDDRIGLGSPCRCAR
jgi:hypothetical protein